MSGPVFGKRHIQMILFAFLLFISHSSKVSMTVCIVAMTDSTTNSNEEIPTYTWSNKGIIVSAFFWGLVLPAIPAGWLATRYGPKWFLVTALISASFSSCLIPTVAAFGSTWVIVLRVIQGFCNGFSLPSLYTLYGKWFPRYERSRCVGFSLAGGIAGISSSTIISGYLASSKYGWPLIFYFYGGLGFTWAVLYSYFGANSPRNHSTISHAERVYIETSLSTKKEKTLRIPWKKILKSKCFLSLVIAESGEQFGFYLIVSQIPLYVRRILNFEIKNNGLISALPHLLTWILIYILGYISDKLISTKTLSITQTRKSIATVGIVFPAISLTLLAYCGPEDTLKAIIFLVTGIGVETGVAFAALYVNSVDLSPNYAGTLAGICQQFAKLGSALAPFLVNFILTNEHDLEQWRIIFYISTAVKVVTGLSFLIFGSGEVQPWNDEVISEIPDEYLPMETSRKLQEVY